MFLNLTIRSYFLTKRLLLNINKFENVCLDFKFQTTTLTQLEISYLKKDSMGIWLNLIQFLSFFAVLPCYIYFYKYYSIINESNFDLYIKNKFIFKIYFMIWINPRHYNDYQKKLITNCDSIAQADYLILTVDLYFRGLGYNRYNWNSSFKNLVFSKKIIALSEEDVKINYDSFNPKYSKHILAYVGANDVSSLKSFYNTTKVFTHLVYGMYIESHKTSYDEFVKRDFYIQSAISNINYMVNSNRAQYLAKCMSFFGKNKVANYGRLYHNQDFPNNNWLNNLPPTAYFGFAMENSIADYRITEKLFFSYRNDVIPIYRGSIKNKEYLEEYGVNTKAFIDASNMSPDELVNYLNDLISEEGKKKMYDIYIQPLIPNKTFFDEKLKKSYGKIFDQIIKM